jgi:hypothetical protein
MHVNRASDEGNDYLVVQIGCGAKAGYGWENILKQILQRLNCCLAGTNAWMKRKRLEAKFRALEWSGSRKIAFTKPKSRQLAFLRKEKLEIGFPFNVWRMMKAWCTGDRESGPFSNQNHILFYVSTDSYYMEWAPRKDENMGTVIATRIKLYCHGVLTV